MIRILNSSKIFLTIFLAFITINTIDAQESNTLNKKAIQTIGDIPVPEGYHRFSIKENSFADEKHIASYENIDGIVKPGNNSHGVIMTFGHKSDGVVLEQLLDKNFSYIGMMASKKKREMLFKDLNEKGFKKEQLLKVNSPIGIKIGAKTPEEISISIAAELIEHWSEKRRGR